MTLTAERPTKRPPDTAHAVTRYAERVADGSFAAGPLVRAACRRHLDDLIDGAERGLAFDDDSADHAIGFFDRYLRLSEGEFAGAPFRLQLWQQFIVGSIFGWLGSDGYRRYRKAYVETPKGSGKTPLAAGIGLYMLVADGEKGAEVYSAAVTHSQARIAFEDARHMAEQSPDLRKMLLIGTNNIAHERSGSFFRPVSSQHRSLDGKRVAMAIIDELHEHRTSMVVEKVQAGTKGRRQPLIFEITNSGFDRLSICWQHHEYSRQVVERSIVDDGWFAYVCGLDKEDDWIDETTWAKVNPNLDISVTRAYYREQVREARGIPAKENIVRRLNFCEWTRSDTRWINDDVWDANDLGLDDTGVTTRRWYGGLDLMSTRDICAWIRVSPRSDETDAIIDVVGRFWCPEGWAFSTDNQYAASYQAWANAGLLTLTPGSATSFKAIRDHVIEDANAVGLTELAIDRAQQGAESAIELAGEGLSIFAMGSGFGAVTAAMRALEERLLTHRLNHGGNAILAAQAAALRVATNAAGEIRPSREESSQNVAGMYALLMALDRLIRQPIEEQSVYETRGVLSI